MRKKLTDIDHDPSKIARAERKAQVDKNKRQRAQNTAHAQGMGAISGPSSQERRKKEINKTLAATRVSTASMGRFDKVLEGESKLKGVKRKVRSINCCSFSYMGELTCACSSNLQRHLPSGKRQQALL